MDLIVAATERELKPFLEQEGQWEDACRTCITGVGCLETTLNLSKFLYRLKPGTLSRVINVGVGGAFVGTGLDMLDVCLAESETLADFGIAYQDRIEPFDFSEKPIGSIRFNRQTVSSIHARLSENGVAAKRGPFVSVNSVSATEQRGRFFKDRYGAIIENMEGFAVARVCQDLSIPCIEMRTVSNYVEDRNLNNWQLEEACNVLAKALICLLR